MNQNKANCLYCFIKEQAKLKGRPLKIICDWDECLMPRDAFTVSKRLKKLETTPLLLIEKKQQRKVEPPKLPEAKLIFTKKLLSNLISDLIIPQNYRANRRGFIPSSQDDAVSCPRKR
ncbi:hypothetical protein BC938DRAFT_470772 [Jimgerdemannia flammicorona]|uniref:Uncharacterized protein n=1 Tax=Jimgerdemannia flammicorona TaxID=994334 RepID=A0A433Q9H3_9FUNG|nr:hypothetical protein BC938DRAFT_470772 [Jimgerdemannia flammicorona]